MLRIGHRGAKGYIAENTLLSFQKAIELGANMIELDIHKSRDGIPVVIHDATIDRTTTGTGLVSDFTADELREFGIPTLKDVFQLVDNRCEINIEIKTYDATQGVLNLIEQYPNWKNRVVISSFDWNSLQEVRFHSDEIRLGVLTETDLDSAFAFAKFIRAYSIHPYYPLLTAENTNKIQKAGYLVFPWTVNDHQDIFFVKSLNVDGIITDFPDRI